MSQCGTCPGGDLAIAEVLLGMVGGLLGAVGVGVVLVLVAGGDLDEVLLGRVGQSGADDSDGVQPVVQVQHGRWSGQH